jgi:hypothetical protein
MIEFYEGNYFPDKNEFLKTGLLRGSENINNSILFARQEERSP